MRVVMIAGEASGDLLGANLLKRLRKRCPDVEVEGIGGPRMIAEGCRTLYPMERLSVLGLVETMVRLPELIPVRARLIRRFLDDPPDLFVGVDAPEFNLTIAHRLRAAGVRTVHYVSPSVWAWRRYRIKKIARALDLMLVLFPFETEFYRQHGVDVRFVGHPLADLIELQPDRAGARRTLGVDPGAEVVAILPGSRMSEARNLAPAMIATACWLSERRPGVRFVAAMTNDRIRAEFETALAAAGAVPCIDIVDGQAREVMTAADVVLLASGTATLEAMLLKRPMVITYRVSALTWTIMKPLVAANISFVGLPNLLGHGQVVPEFLQKDAVADNLGPALLGFLEHPAQVEQLRETFTAMHEQLRRDASGRACDAIVELMQRAS